MSNSYRNGDFSVEFDYEEKGGRYIAKLAGVMDMARCQANSSFSQEVGRRTTVDVPLVLDLGDVERMDCSGVASIIAVLGLRKDGATTILRNIPDHVRRLFDVYQFPYSSVDVEQ